MTRAYSGEVITGVHLGEGGLMGNMTRGGGGGGVKRSECDWGPILGGHCEYMA